MVHAVHNSDRDAGVAGDQSGAGGAVCVGGAAVGAPPPGGPGRPGAGLCSWLAGPYGDLPINYDGTYAAAEIDAICDQWNRALYLQLCLAQAGRALCGPVGAPDVAQVGVR